YDQQVAIGRNRIGPREGEWPRFNVVLARDGGEVQIAVILVIAVDRVFAMPLEEISVERLRTRHSQERRREHLFASKFNRFAPELAFLVVGDRFEHITRQSVAIHYHGPAIALKDDQVGGGGQSQFVLRFDPLGRRRV